MLPTFGGTELIILLVIILLLFGARRIPELARSLGRGAREFRKEISEAGGDEAQDREEKGREESSPNGAAHDEPTRAEKVETTAASRSEAEV